MALTFLNRLVINWLNGEQKSRPGWLRMPMCDYERIRRELKPCDVILVESTSRISAVIRWITASPWTHAALYLGKLHDIEDADLRADIQAHYACEPNTHLIIESLLGHGVVIHPLSIYQQDHLRICRPKDLSYQDAQDVMRYAIGRLGVGYDVRHIFDLARFLFPWIFLPRRWRSSLFKSHPGKSIRTVCSTMLAEAFGFIQFPILPLVKKTSAAGGVQLFRRNPKLCVPSDFDYSPYFEIIKYPFVDFSFQGDHRLLPWRGKGALSGEELRLFEQDNDDQAACNPHDLNDTQNT